MGIIKTMGKFCYIQCDLQNCSKKIEKNDQDTLQEFAKLCGWKSRGSQWICPDCLEKEKKNESKPAKSKKKTA